MTRLSLISVKNRVVQPLQNKRWLKRSATLDCSQRITGQIPGVDRLILILVMLVLPLQGYADSMAVCQHDAPAAAPDYAIHDEHLPASRKWLSISIEKEQNQDRRQTRAG